MPSALMFILVQIFPHPALSLRRFLARHDNAPYHILNLFPEGNASSLSRKSAVSHSAHESKLFHGWNLDNEQNGIGRLT